MILNFEGIVTKIMPKRRPTLLLRDDLEPATALSLKLFAGDHLLKL